MVENTPRLLDMLSSEGGAAPWSDENHASWLELQVSPEPRSAGVARRARGVYCQQLGVPERLLETGGLAISELVTNSVVTPGRRRSSWPIMTAGT